ncbi:MAG: SDR family oxidoreductase [Aquificae bacterium]|nr:SDR family oxidoreductase [Aquificota bacterium]
MSKVAIITGVRRIGFYAAQFLLSQGFDLAVLYRSSEERARELKTYGEGLGRRVLTFEVDLTDPSTYRGIPDEVFDRLGRIDLLVNAASPFGKLSWEETDAEDLRFYFSAVVESAFLLSKGAARYMLKNSGPVKGRIVNFGDWATAKGSPYRGFVPYLVAKGALDALTRVLAVELAPEVLVNEIALGPVLPPFLEGREKGEGWDRYVKRKTLLGRPVGLEDVLAALDFLLKTKTLTGEILLLDAGQRFVGGGYAAGEQFQ